MTLGLNSRRDLKDSEVAVVIGKPEMMGGMESVSVGPSPKSSNPRILNDDNEEEGVGVGGVEGSGESRHGGVTLLEVKNNPNILQHRLVQNCLNRSVGSGLGLTKFVSTSPKLFSRISYKFAARSLGANS